MPLKGIKEAERWEEAVSIYGGALNQEVEVVLEGSQLLSIKLRGKVRRREGSKHPWYFCKNFLATVTVSGP